MSKHTPGPWTITEYGRVIDRNGETVRTEGVALAHQSDNETKTNARLIAAAPELLEALKSAVETIEWMRACTDPAEDEIDKEVETALAVISKATGE